MSSESSQWAHSYIIAKTFADIHHISESCDPLTFCSEKRLISVSRWTWMHDRGITLGDGTRGGQHYIAVFHLTRNNFIAVWFLIQISWWKNLAIFICNFSDSSNIILPNFEYATVSNIQVFLTLGWSSVVFALWLLTEKNCLKLPKGDLMLP